MTKWTPQELADLKAFDRCVDRSFKPTNEEWEEIAQRDKEVKEGQTDPKVVKETARKHRWRIQNADHVREYEHSRYLANKDKFLAKSKEHHKKHRQDDLDRMSSYYQRNHEEQLQKHRAYKDANREKIRAENREYYAKHKDEINAKRRERRAKKRELDSRRACGDGTS